MISNQRNFRSSYWVPEMKICSKKVLLKKSYVPEMNISSNQEFPGYFSCLLSCLEQSWDLEVGPPVIPSSLRTGFGSSLLTREASNNIHEWDYQPTRRRFATYRRLVWGRGQNETNIFPHLLHLHGLIYIYPSLHFYPTHTGPKKQYSKN